MKKNIINIFIFSLPICFYNVNMVISIMINMYYLKNLDNFIYMSSFSIAMGYYYLFGNFINFGFAEIVGIKTSKNYGKKNINKCSIYYFKALFLLIIFIILFFPLFMNMEYLLVILKNNKNESKLIGNFFKKFYFVMIIISLNRMNESYLMSQNKTHIFIIINSICLLVLPIFSNYFILKKNYKLTGVVYSILLKELLNLFFGLINFYKNAEINLVEFKFIINKFWKFTCYSIYIISSLVSESIGIQSILLFLGMESNSKDIIIWGILLNIFDLNYYIGFSFSNGLRTYVGNLLGKKKFIKANMLVNKFLFMLFILYLFELIIINLFLESIAKLFIKDPEIDLYFKKYLRIYSIFIIHDFCWSIIGTTLRLMGKHIIQSYLTIIFTSINMPLMSFILIHLYKFGLNAGFYIYVLTITFLNIFQFYFYSKFDWKKLYKIEENKENLKLLDGIW